MAGYIGAGATRGGVAVGQAKAKVELIAGGTSRVSVASTATLSDAAVAAAVDEAGYDLVEAGR